MQDAARCRCIPRYSFVADLWALPLASLVSPRSAQQPGCSMSGTTTTTTTTTTTINYSTCITVGGTSSLLPAGSLAPHCTASPIATTTACPSPPRRPVCTLGGIMTAL
ncbi:hypothetical protein IWX50DRAFT_99256 [Phyllosticta citricarpa]